MIQNSPETGQISTWDKAKDAALIGFLSLSSLALIKLMTDVSELKTNIAIYQTRSESLAAEFTRLRSDVDQHFRDDRERFKASGVR